MRQEAEQYADEDHRRREAAETRNQGEQLVYQTEKFLKDNEDKVPGEVKTEVEAAVARAEGEAQGRGHRRDPHRHREGRRGPARSSARPCTPTPRPRRRAAPAPAGAGAGEAKADDDVVDAEIVDDEQEREGRCRVTEETPGFEEKPDVPSGATPDDAEPKAAEPADKEGPAAPAGDAAARSPA